MLDVGGVLAAGGARVVRGHGAPLADLKHRYKVITVVPCLGHLDTHGAVAPWAPRPPPAHTVQSGLRPCSCQE